MKFVFSHSKLRKNFFTEIFKIEGGQVPLPPLPSIMLRRSSVIIFFMTFSVGSPVENRVKISL